MIAPGTYFIVVSRLLGIRFVGRFLLFLYYFILEVTFYFYLVFLFSLFFNYFILFLGHWLLLRRKDLVRLLTKL
jgi:hypothetical protein